MSGSVLVGIGVIGEGRPGGEARNLGLLPVEGINLLDTGITQNKRGVVMCDTGPLVENFLRSTHLAEMSLVWHEINQLKTW